MHCLKHGSKPSFAAVAMGALLAPGLAAVTQAAAVDTSLQTATLNQADDLTVDTNTGLEFLDIDQTANQSFNQIQNSSFVTQDGFRFATQAEYRQLLEDANFTDFSGDFNTADEPAAENLLSNFLGETIPPGQPFQLGGPNGTSISDGFYAYVVDSPFATGDQVNVVGVDYQSAALGQAPQDQARVVSSLNTFGRDFSSPIAGGLLVRQATPVPEPSTLLMGGLGLGLLAAGRRRRRARADHANG